MSGYYLAWQGINVSFQSVVPLSLFTVFGIDNESVSTKIALLSHLAGKVTETILVGVTVAKLVSSYAPSIGKAGNIWIGIGAGTLIFIAHTWSPYKGKDLGKGKLGLLANYASNVTNTVGVVQAVANRGFSNLAANAIGLGFFATNAMMLHCLRDS